MKIQFTSDLHLEFYNDPSDYPEIPMTDADIIVLAGDIHTGTKAVEFAWNLVKTHQKPVYYVAGNHEFYHHALPKNYDDIRQKVTELDPGVNGPKLRFMQNDAVLKPRHGVRILGCTLWTSFELNGAPRIAMKCAWDTMNDYQKIRLSCNAEKWPKLAPADTRQQHQKSVAWMKEKLEMPFDGQTLIITHHAPHPKSLQSYALGEPHNPAYASDMTPIMDLGVDVWIHGHTHETKEYQVGDTQVLCNPRGHPFQSTGWRGDIVWEM